MKTLFRYAALFALLGLCLGACSGERMPEYYENSYDMGGDVLSVRFAYDTMEKDEKGKKIYFSDREMNEIFAVCCAIFDETAALLDHTDPATNLYEIDQVRDAVFDCDGEVMDLLGRTFTLSAQTNGAYQPVFGTVTALRSEDAQPTPERLTEALAHTGTDKLTLEDASVYKTDPLAQVDLTSVQSGYAMEKIIAYLQESPLVYGFVTLGGSAGVFGTKPEDAAFDIGILSNAEEAQDGAVDGYMHISSGYVFVTSDALGGALNCQTGEAADTDLSRVVVCADDAVAACALSDALYAMGSDAAMALYDEGTLSFEAAFFLRDGTVQVTDGARRVGLYVPVDGDKKK